MSTSTTRRRFMAWSPFGALALLAACTPPAPVPAPPAPMPAPAPPAAVPVPTATGMVDESSPQATSLGYVADASRVDRQKFSAHVPGSVCSNCALYQGQAGAASGPCPIFAGQQVAAGGWCTTWARKA